MAITFDQAFDALRSWYWTEVNEWATDFDKRILEREWSSREDFQDAFHQETDGAACIIYTAQAWAVCLASDNDDAYEEEFGEPAPTIEARALMAFQRDILNRMVEDPATLDDEPEEQDDPTEAIR